MPYADRWGITITKVSDGVYDVSRNDRSGRVQIDQTFTNETLNVAAALFRAIELVDPDLTPLWRARYDYARARWKVAAYTEVRQGTSGALRTRLTAKINYWQSEVTRLAGADS